MKEVKQRKERRYQEIEQDSCGIGMIVKIDGTRSHDVVIDGLSIVEELDHRAGRDATGTVGDGVGILTQLPSLYFVKVMKDMNLTEGNFGVGMFFMPVEEKQRKKDMKLFEKKAEEEGLTVLGWRDVPVHPEILGAPARDSQPFMKQVFVERPEDCEAGFAFDRKLYFLRRLFEQECESTYVCSLSSRTIVYKGMFLTSQLRRFYDDLTDPDYVSAIALVHSRFSTNTTPSWMRAHPYRMIAHNGEINTIHGNADRMMAREESLKSDMLDERVYPVIEESGSDSAMLDNTLEFFYMSGMELPLAVMMCIPEPWRKNPFMEQDRKDFYHYYATMMEPWDGPAAIIYTDGEMVGATLDRNGLRPSRYYLTDDGRVILSSEAGVLDLEQCHIAAKARLEPGKMLLVDTKAQKLYTDDECKNRYVEAHPYGQWLKENLVHLSERSGGMVTEPAADRRTMRLFGCSYEEVMDGILPMAESGNEPVGAMGNDTPLALLSKGHPLLFSYFHQMFAQVTNPPIDCIREEIVTDTAVFLGPQGNLFAEVPENCGLLELDSPILTEAKMEQILSLKEEGLASENISLCYDRRISLKEAMERLITEAENAVGRGAHVLILTDRDADRRRLPIPSLLACSALQQYLVHTRQRTQVSLIIETGEARDVHSCAALLGFGASAVHPWLAHGCITQLVQGGWVKKSIEEAVESFDHAVLKGIVKTASKMGISTLQAYQGARIFEAVGLEAELINEYFGHISSAVGGAGLSKLEEDTRARHALAFGKNTYEPLDSAGMHKTRSGKDKEVHLYKPETIVHLQRAVRNDDYEEYRKYRDLLDAESPHSLKDLFDFVPKNEPVPLEEVESVFSIFRRFQTSAMSYGALSEEAHQCMAEAMNSIDTYSNTGEGGENAKRYGTSSNSAIKQVASGRFGVTSAYLCSAKEIQIKIAQGAKPGEGGQLPGKKVYPWVAETRFATPGVTLISPPPHHDIYSIEDLSQLIHDLKSANPDASISVKLVSEKGVGTIAAGVAKTGAEEILISGYDGGTGAAPMSSIHHAGLPWELGVSEAERALRESGLRRRVVLETDGKLMRGRDIAAAAMLGAERFSFGTLPLVAMGCMMMRACNQDSCPFGVATQNETLRKRFAGKPEHVVNLMKFLAEDLREVMASLGFRTVEEMVGRNDCLKKKDDAAYKDIDLTELLIPYEGDEPLHHVDGEKPDLKLNETLDARKLLPWAKTVIGKSKISVDVSVSDRSLGTMLGSFVTKTYGSDMADDSFVVSCKGSAGQSFGAFLPKGVTLKLTGDVNDYPGKGLSGGKIVVKAPEDVTFDPSMNILAGNVALYGATNGTAYFAGVAGERFCVRNSGAKAVVEGCGDHGLEYMTGGMVMILGKTGKNLAAGMSGGTAYVLDEAGTLSGTVNPDQKKNIHELDEQDQENIKEMLEDYVKETGSKKGEKILSDPDTWLSKFRKLEPAEYTMMHARIRRYESEGWNEKESQLMAFNEAIEEVR